MLRCYPEGFAAQILKGYEESTTFDCPLRFKKPINLAETDRYIFQSLPLGDPWCDSKIHLAWAYLYRSKHLRIPDSWVATMKQFDAELSAKVI